MPAANQTSTQIRTAAQYRPQRHIKLQNDLSNFGTTIPVAGILIILRDFSCKKTCDSLSTDVVKMPRSNHISHSLRDRTGYFFVLLRLPLKPYDSLYLAGSISISRGGSVLVSAIVYGAVRGRLAMRQGMSWACVSLWAGRLRRTWTLESSLGMGKAVAGRI